MPRVPKLSTRVKLVLLAALVAVVALAVYLYIRENSLPSPTFTNVVWEPEIIRAGQPVTFRLTVEHRGIFSVHVVIRVYASKYAYSSFPKAVPVGYVEVELGPGATKDVEFHWTPPEEGFYKLRFEIEGGGYLNQLVYAAPREGGPEAFTFVVFGDNRPSDGVMPQPPVFSEIAREVNLIHPDFAVLVGDVIYGYRSDIARLKRQWSDFLSVYNSFEVPVFVAPGNHEMQTENVPESGSLDAQTLYVMNLGRLYYAFAYGNSLFIVLDTDVVGQAAEISGEQLEWLKKMLELSRNYTHTFVFMHRPVVSYEGADLLNNHYEILPLLLRYNVTAVFQGHNHVYYYEEVNGTLFYVTGGAGAPLHRTPERGGVYHFLLVEVNGSSVNVKFVPPYAIKVRQLESSVEITYAFTEKIVFSSDGYTWVAEPASLRLRGLRVRSSSSDVEVEGGRVLYTWSLDGAYEAYVEVVVRPGEKREIRLVTHKA